MGPTRREHAPDYVQTPSVSWLWPPDDQRRLHPSVFAKQVEKRLCDPHKPFNAPTLEE